MRILEPQSLEPEAPLFCAALPVRDWCLFCAFAACTRHRLPRCVSLTVPPLRVPLSPESRPDSSVFCRRILQTMCCMMLFRFALSESGTMMQFGLVYFYLITLEERRRTCITAPHWKGSTARIQYFQLKIMPINAVCSITPPERIKRQDRCA